MQPRGEFVFHSERLARLVMEHAVSLLPYTDVAVTGAAGAPFPGRRFTGKVG